MNEPGNALHCTAALLLPELPDCHTAGSRHHHIHKAWLLVMPPQPTVVPCCCHAWRCSTASFQTSQLTAYLAQSTVQQAHRLYYSQSQLYITKCCLAKVSINAASAAPDGPAVRILHHAAAADTAPDAGSAILTSASITHAERAIQQQRCQQVSLLALSGSEPVAAARLLHLQSLTFSAALAITSNVNHPGDLLADCLAHSVHCLDSTCPAGLWRMEATITNSTDGQHPG